MLFLIYLNLCIGWFIRKEIHDLFYHHYTKSLALQSRKLLNPQSPSWFRDLIKSVTTKYGLKVNVVNSRLDETSIY